MWPSSAGGSSVSSRWEPKIDERFTTSENRLCSEDTRGGQQREVDARATVGTGRRSNAWLVRHPLESLGCRSLPPFVRDRIPLLSKFDHRPREQRRSILKFVGVFEEPSRIVS